jgi:hypothetical protein
VNCFCRLGIADVFHIRVPVSLAVLHHVRNAGIDDHQIPDNSVIVSKRKIVGRKALAQRFLDARRSLPLLHCQTPGVRQVLEFLL